MNHKSLILDALDKLRKEEIANKEPWKAKAYSGAIKAIAAFDKSIETAEDVKDLKGIGKSIYAKIEEIIETGKLKRLEDYNTDGKIKMIEDLTRIHGIGPAKAKELVDKHNIKNIQDLENNLELLNDKQKIGIKYYKDFELRIPRAEMVKQDDYLKSIITKIDPKLIVEVVGSYRRKAKDSGDIDILIKHLDDPEDHDDIIKNIVEKLKKEKYLIDDFALGGKKYLGICRLKRHRHFRRIDMLFTTANEFPFAQLYFTGSKEFNVVLRNICLSKNLSLSEYGLKHLSGPKKGEFIDETFHTEEEILNYLGYKYVPPEKRTNTLKDFKI